MGRAVALSSLFAVGCASPARPPAPDAAEVALCGNGHIDLLDPFGKFVEACDDGALNGIPPSLCTKQCLSGVLPMWNLPPATPLAGAPTMSAHVVFPEAPRAGLAYVTTDRRTLHLAQALFAGQAPVERALPLQGELVTLSRVIVETAFLSPVWVERHGDGSLHLFVATWSVGQEPSVHELAYPIAGGTAPRLASSWGFRWTTLVDVTAAGELAVATLSFPSPTEMHVEQRMFPGSGRVPGILAEGTQQDTRTRMGLIHHLVQFFDDTGTFVAFAIDAQRQTIETGRGRWPFQPAAAKPWWGLEDCSVPDDEQWPLPFAIVAQSGAIYLWQFDEGVAPEQLVAPFATVTAGTRTLSTALPNQLGLWVIEPSGDGLGFVQNDCRDLTGPGLSPQRIFSALPGVTGTIVRGAGIAPSGFTFGSTFYGY